MVVAIDTSGSTQWFLADFLAELTGLLNSFGSYDVTVIQCDAAVQSVERYTPDRPLGNDLALGQVPEDFKFHGGGGTSFVPVFEHVANTERPDALVYLTDGWGDAPEHPPNYPVLWALTPYGEAPATWGQIVDLDLDVPDGFCQH